jgi:hypothetical protein
MDVWHVNRSMSLRQRTCRSEDLGVAARNGRAWPAGEVSLTSLGGGDARLYLLAIPQVALNGEALTAFLGQVAPFGCPVPGSLIRAYSLPDSPFPSILLKEHEEGANGIGDAYRRFLAVARRPWMAALAGSGPGLCPALAWEVGATRRLLGPEELGSVSVVAGLTPAGVADGYLGRGLLLLANPDLAGSWPTLMSLGGPTKIRKITGREFPVWVDLPAHQPSLLESPVLRQVEALLDSR